MRLQIGPKPRSSAPQAGSKRQRGPHLQPGPNLLRGLCATHICATSNFGSGSALRLLARNVRCSGHSSAASGPVAEKVGPRPFRNGYSPASRSRQCLLNVLGDGSRGDTWPTSAWLRASTIWKKLYGSGLTICTGLPKVSKDFARAAWRRGPGHFGRLRRPNPPILPRDFGAVFPAPQPDPLSGGSNLVNFDGCFLDVLMFGLDVWGGGSSTIGCR